MVLSLRAAAGFGARLLARFITILATFSGRVGAGGLARHERRAAFLSHLAGAEGGNEMIPVPFDEASGRKVHGLVRSP
jgi:hypothetical protein